MVTETRTIRRRADAPWSLCFTREWLAQALYGEIPGVSYDGDGTVCYALDDGPVWYLLDGPAYNHAPAGSVDGHYCGTKPKERR